MMMELNALLLKYRHLPRSARLHVLVGGLSMLLAFNVWKLSTFPSANTDLQRISIAASHLAHELRDYVAVLGQHSPLPPHGSPTRGAISSGYGMRLHPRYKRWRPHHGVDIAVPVGTPVMVTADGWISRIDEDPKGWGLFLDVIHPASGFLTRYAHLSAVRVRVGEPVRRGRVIALSGISGNAVGAHLHYEIRTRRGRSVDPLSVQVP